MNKRKAMIEALVILSNTAEALSQDGLGMDDKDEKKVQEALKIFSLQLQKRCQRLNWKPHF